MNLNLLILKVHISPRLVSIPIRDLMNLNRAEATEGVPKAATFQSLLGI